MKKINKKVIKLYLNVIFDKRLNLTLPKDKILTFFFALDVPTDFASFPFFLLFLFLSRFLSAFLGLFAHFHVDSGELWCLLVALPLLTIILCVVLKDLALRHHVANGREERYQDKVDKSWLPFGDPSCFTIT